MAEQVGKPRAYCEKCLQRHENHRQIVFSAHDWSQAVAFNVCWGCHLVLCDGMRPNSVGDSLWTRNNPIINQLYSRRVFSLQGNLADPEWETVQTKWAEAAHSYLAEVTERSRRAERASQMRFRCQLDYDLFDGHYQCRYDDGLRIEYYGSVKDGVPHGRGLQIDSEGKEYWGEWAFGHENTTLVPDSEGSMTWPDGSKYVGGWKRGLMHGWGVKRWADRRIYTGNWANGRQHGKGEKVWADGTTFTGHYDLGLKRGEGKLVAPDGTETLGPFHETAFEDNDETVALVLKRRAVYGQPQSLFSICRDTVARCIITRPDAFRASRLMERLPAHVKPLVAEQAILQEADLSEKFALFVRDIAWFRLTKVSCAGMRLNAQDLRTLGYFLESNDAMSELDVSTVGMGARQLPSIATFLRLVVANDNLTALNLSYNSLGDTGALVLAEHLLTENECTISLGLAGNNIGPAGAKDLARALMKNTTLTSLDLNFNRIGVAGATWLAPVLTSTRTLHEIRLRSNQLGKNGSTVIMEGLKENEGCLIQVALADNHMGKQRAKAMARISLASTYQLLRGMGLPPPVPAASSASPASTSGSVSAAASAAPSEAPSGAASGVTSAVESLGVESSDEDSAEGSEAGSPRPEDYSPTSSDNDEEERPEVDGEGDKSDYAAYDAIAEAVGFYYV